MVGGRCGTGGIGGPGGIDGIDCVGGLDATRHEWHDFMVGLLWRKVQVQRGGPGGGRDDHGIALTF